MVSIEEIVDEPLVLPSAERLLDAEEIETLAQNDAQRPTVKMQLESLAKKLRKESQALQRLEASQAKVDAAAAVAKKEEDDDDEKLIVEDVTAKDSKRPAAAVKPVPKPPDPAPSPAKPPVTGKFVSIDTFAFDSGKYNSPTVSIYISLDGVKEIPRDNITCDFTTTSFDLVVRDLQNKSYRLYKDNLAHDIDPSTSKILIKVDRIIIKLGKTKGEYGYDTWTDLVDKKKPPGSKKKNDEDPGANIMNLMKDLYDSGDDNMKKMIGETMEKQRRGELGKEGAMDGM